MDDHDAESTLITVFPWLRSHTLLALAPARAPWVD